MGRSETCLGRDASRLRGKDAARRLYAERYQPAFDLYERLCAPEKSADILLITEDFQHPEVHVLRNGRLGREGRRELPYCS